MQKISRFFILTLLGAISFSTVEITVAQKKKRTASTSPRILQEKTEKLPEEPKRVDPVVVADGGITGASGIQQLSWWQSIRKVISKASKTVQGFAQTHPTLARIGLRTTALATGILGYVGMTFLPKNSVALTMGQFIIADATRLAFAGVNELSQFLVGLGAAGGAYFLDSYIAPGSHGTIDLILIPTATLVSKPLIRALWQGTSIKNLKVELRGSATKSAAQPTTSEQYEKLEAQNKALAEEMKKLKQFVESHLQHPEKGVVVENIGALIAELGEEQAKATEAAQHALQQAEKVALEAQQRAAQLKREEERKQRIAEQQLQEERAEEQRQEAQRERQLQEERTAHQEEIHVDSRP